MNIIEKQVDFGRTLFEINQNTLQQFASSVQENVSRYIELNRQFSEKLPEVRDVASFVELQKQYGETLWGNVKHAGQVQTDIVKAALEETGTAVKTVFSTES